MRRKRRKERKKNSRYCGRMIKRINKVITMCSVPKSIETRLSARQQ